MVEKRRCVIEGDDTPKPLIEIVVYEDERVLQRGFVDDQQAAAGQLEAKGVSV